MYRQYTLTHQQTERVGWIDHEPALRVGQALTIKGDSQAVLWRVTRAGHVALTTRPQHDWKVGGLTYVTGR